MDSIIPIILAGGSGERLWPLSRKSYPKQFSKIINKLSLFQETALRLTTSDKLTFDNNIVLTNSNFRFIVGEQLQEVGVDFGQILIEPQSKNTAPAILAASMLAYKKNNESILLVAPSDHVISNKQKFYNDIEKGLHEVKNGRIVTFGVKPTHAETGYGYLEIQKETRNNVSKIKQFIEKPDKKNAEKMFKTNNFLWNAGIFLFKAKDIISAFKEHEPKMVGLIKSSFENAKQDLDFLRLNSDTWSLVKNISIDYAIMEKVKNLSVVPLSSGWSDLGNWESVWQEMHPDNNGLSLSSNAYADECSNTLLRSEDKNQIIVGLGLKDIIAVAMPDAVLVANKNKTQEIKKIVDLLKKQNISQAEILPKDHRPWGWFESLIISKRFQVKRICVNPGASLSLQSHHHRSEHWIVVEGTAKVIIDKKIKLVTEGESVYVPLGSVHRIENPGKLAIILIEIQTGAYLGEDDIVRYEDKYSRN